MPPRRSQDEPRVLGPAGRHGFTWGLPHTINLPHKLPGAAHSAGWWAAAENIVAAYNAGFQAAARGAYGLPAVADDEDQPVYRTVAVETTEAAARATVERHWAGPEWDVRVRCVNESTWAVDVAETDAPAVPFRKPGRARDAFERAA